MNDRSGSGAGIQIASGQPTFSTRLPGQFNSTQPKVAILLCTYHGQQYLTEQLESFAAQSYASWVVWASDDGSQDETRAILERYQLCWGKDRISIHSGPEDGFIANFLSLTCNADIQADFYAYSDQDDIWEPDKLQRAMDWMRTVSDGAPVLYCSRTRLVDKNNSDIGFSPLFRRPPGFANALIQSLAGGNTMVFNDLTRRLLCVAGDQVDVVSHDWWVYMAVTGCGGKIYYDTRPSVRYRQHGSNVIGINSGWPARVKRLLMLLQGRFRSWNDRNIRALEQLRPHFTAENLAILDRFISARDSWLVPRLRGLKQSGIYRQTLMGNLGLIAAAFFGKL